MLAGVGHEEVAIEAMKRGAQDYLNKDLLTTKALARAVAHAIEKVAAYPNDDDTQSSPPQLGDPFL